MSTPPHRVGILVFDEMKLLDIAGPGDVFTEANRSGANYVLSMVSADGRDVRSSMGMRIPVDGIASAGGRFDTVLVTGNTIFPTGGVAESQAAAASAMARGSSRTGSICTGAFVLAAAGLLEGRRATTHWNFARELARRYPGTRVEADAIVVRDEDTYSSGGVTAGIDLALSLVEEDHGIELARSVARSLVVYLQRDGGQSPFSGSLLGQVPRASLLRTVIEAVHADPAAEYPVSRLAEIAQVSPRHLSRLFHDELDTTPGKFVGVVRFEKARELLDAGLSVTEVAETSGFGTSESMRRAFLSHLSIPPSRYRGRFAAASKVPV